MRFVFLTYLLLFSTLSLSQEKDSIEVDLSKKISLAKTDSIKIFYTYKLASKVSKYNYEKANEILNDILKIIEISNKNTEYFLTYKARVYSRIASLQSNFGNYNEALAFNFKSLKILTQLNNTSRVSTIYNNLGMLYNRMKNYEKAVEYFYKAIALRKDFKDKSRVAKTYNTLGVTFFYQKQYDSARVYYLKAKKNHSSIAGKAKANMNLATLYYVTENKQKAIDVFEENLKIFKTLNQQNSTSITLRNLAKGYSDIGNNDKALKYINEALNLVKTINKKNTLPEIYLLKSTIEENLNNKTQALRDYKLYKIYSDSIYNLRKEKEIANIELNHKLDKEKLIFSNEKEALIIQAKNQKRKTLLYIILFILSMTGIVLLIFSLFNRKKLSNERIKKEELERKLLDEKLKNATYQTKKVVADNKMRIQFKKELLKKLKTLKGINYRENPNFQSLINDIQIQISTESKFDYLGENIEGFNENFHQMLSDKFPKLTKSEREICALMRIDLSLKEITIIRNISISSIKSFRYRIRKKMNVSKEIDLDSYIQQLFLHE